MPHLLWTFSPAGTPPPATLVDFWVKLCFFLYAQTYTKTPQTYAKTRKSTQNLISVCTMAFGNHPLWYPMKGFCKLGVAKKGCPSAIHSLICRNGLVDSREVPRSIC